MKNLIIPKNYKSLLNIKETEISIKKIKDFFQNSLAKTLNLTRVSAPLFVDSSTGLNDTLNGVERPIKFNLLEQPDTTCEIIHSLAKWKRLALKRYNFNYGEGLYTDMNAIRRDEITDNLHSLYVDQWDWEKIIKNNERNKDTLKNYVNKIYNVIKSTEAFVCGEYTHIEKTLPDNIKFITTSELYNTYPNLTPKQREKEAVKKYGAIFLMEIGNKLINGLPHDGRAPDYDDWNLNGDIIFYYPLLDTEFEISSMGIRVNKNQLIAQLEASHCKNTHNQSFQKALLNDELPQTIGGGIGQSRLCMYFLKKAHIGEVQSSIWTHEDYYNCKKNNINLL